MMAVPKVWVVSMVVDVITIFPEFFSGILTNGILKRAIAGRQTAIHLRNLRDFADDPHRSVDDRPFGGGPGMVFKPEPLFRAVESIQEQARGEHLRIVLLTPQGCLLTQRIVEDLSHEDRLVLICGRYEGVDERVSTHLATDEISIGDYVLSGGELAAAVVMESVVRLIPGVLGNEESSHAESFSIAPPTSGAGKRGALLAYPQYTRPAEFRRLKVPEVLLSGNHHQIREWRAEQALAKTRSRRPDLLEESRVGDTIAERTITCH
jgi:tRNA (guanine37-N1)-methyltransferase